MHARDPYIAQSERYSSQVVMAAPHASLDTEFLKESKPFLKETLGFDQIPQRKGNLAQQVKHSGFSPPVTALVKNGQAFLKGCLRFGIVAHSTMCIGQIQE